MTYTQIAAPAAHGAAAAIRLNAVTGTGVLDEGTSEYSNQKGMTVMAKRSWSLVVFAFSLSCLAFASYVLIAGRTGYAAALRAATDDTMMIPQPQEWVPFSADVVITHADSTSAVYGSTGTHTAVEGLKPAPRARPP
jgi:hypothetical protein